MNSNVDWEDVRAVLAAAEEGSLSAAARRLGLSQPTMSRRVEALERALGATLFSRSTQGMTLTETGLDLLSHAEAMHAAAHRLELVASGRAEAAAGVVRVTAPRVMATHHLPRILADLAEAAPQVEVELVASDEAQNLLRREADIAIRMFRPTQPDLIARKVADLPLGLYARPAYLARRGRPTKETFRAHRMIGYDRNPIIIDWMTSVGLSPPPGFFRCAPMIRSSTGASSWPAPGWGRTSARSAMRSRGWSG